MSRRFASHKARLALALILSVLTVMLIAPVAGAQQQPLVIYSGRSASLVDELIRMFTEETGIPVQVRYGDTTQLAATILEEGKNTPADVFFAQDAGALGALAAEGRLQTLPASLVERVDPRLRSPKNQWVATSGRARVIVYNKNFVDPAELPTSIWGFVDPKWSGRIGWAPTNASFQSFVTALRVLEGEAKAAEWLRGIVANRPRAYSNNVALYDAVARGEVHVGFSNHYYLFRFLAEQGDAFAADIAFTVADAGSIVNVAGVGILDVSDNREAALRFVEFLLSEKAQQYFVNETYEYPVVDYPTVQPHPRLPKLDEIKTPELDLSNLDDLRGTIDLLVNLGIL